MIEYVKKVFENYATFTGRASRPEFWWFFLFYVIVYVALLILMNIISFFGILLVIFALGILLPYLAVTVRRLHDVGKSGWFIFISLIPLIGSIWLIVLLASDGEPGTNEYGPNPNNPVTDFDFEKQNM